MGKQSAAAKKKAAAKKAAEAKKKSEAIKEPAVLVFAVDDIITVSKDVIAIDGSAVVAGSEGKIVSIIKGDKDVATIYQVSFNQGESNAIVELEEASLAKAGENVPKEEAPPKDVPEPEKVEPTIPAILDELTAQKSAFEGLNDTTVQCVKVVGLLTKKLDQMDKRLSKAESSVKKSPQSIQSEGDNHSVEG